jgi:hypothetical protein
MADACQTCQRMQNIVLKYVSYCDGLQSIAYACNQLLMHAKCY